MKTFTEDSFLQKIVQLAMKNSDIAVLWLYGSQISGKTHAKSDYDLAIAFTKFIKSPLERRLRPELLAIDWTHQLQSAESKISIVDINMIPIPLAWEIVVHGKTLWIQNLDRLWQEEQRIYSQYELDVCYHRRNMERDDSNYWSSIEEHIRICIEQLNEYQAKQAHTTLTLQDYLAIERLLQILIESGISMAKHKVKNADLLPRSNAYDNFELLKEKNIIDSIALTEWKSMIGLRNILVHEYLKINRDIINEILKNKMYMNVLNFLNQCRS